MKRLVVLALCAAFAAAAPLPVVSITVSSSAGPLARRAAELLASRIERRTGVKPAVGTRLPAAGPAVALAAIDSPELAAWKVRAPSAAELGEEGFALVREGERLFVLAREGRGLLYGAGKILRTARYGGGRALVDPPLGIDKPAMGNRMLYLAIHAENFYEMQPAAVIESEIVEDMALWGANGVLVWFDQSQYNDPFVAGLDNAAARERWNKEKEVLKRAQDLGLKPGYTMSDNDLYRNQVTPEVLAPNTEQWAVFQALACPSVPRGREVTLANKVNLARELAEAGVKLELACHFAYDTGGCRCERCRPWVLTFLNLARDVHEVFRKYHPGVRSYMSDWHFTDEEAGRAIDFLNAKKPEWFAGIYKDDRHPADRFKTVDARYPVMTFLEITEIGAWGTVGANPFAKRLSRIFQDLRSTGQVGYVSYSEGIYDDFNKAAAIRLAWNPDTRPAELAANYANYFLSEAGADEFARMIDGMEDSWTNPMGSWGQQRFVQTAEQAAAVEKLALGIAARLPAGVRNHWRWQVLEQRAKIGAAIAEIGQPEAFRARMEEMVRARAPRVESRRVLEARRERLEEYARLVVALRNQVYKEPFTRYPPMIPGDWFMRDRTRLDYGAWVLLLQNLSAVIDGVAKP